MEIEDMLWCDCKTDKDRVAFLKSGRAYDTGIIALSLVSDIVELLEFRMSFEEGE